MKVILLQDVKGLGKKLDVKDVSDGYAKNALLPKNLAKAATPEDIENLDAQKALQLKRLKEEKEKLLKLSGELNKKELKFLVKTGAKKEVFGSVTADMIKIALRKEGIETDKINLVKPLRELGEHEVEIALGMGVSGKVKVILLRQI